MTQCNLTQTEQMRRKEIADHTRTMVVNLLQVDAEDETSIMCGYRDYYLQISFSELHPLMGTLNLNTASLNRHRNACNHLNDTLCHRSKPSVYNSHCLYVIHRRCV